MDDSKWPLEDLAPEQSSERPFDSGAGDRPACAIVKKAYRRLSL